MTSNITIRGNKLKNNRGNDEIIATWVKKVLIEDNKIETNYGTCCISTSNCQDSLIRKNHLDGQNTVTSGITMYGISPVSESRIAFIMIGPSESVPLMLSI